MGMSRDADLQCQVKLFQQIGRKLLFYKSNSGTKQHCIIKFLINTGLLDVYFILHYHLFFCKKNYFFKCLYFSEYCIRMSLSIYYLRKRPSIKYICNWQEMVESYKMLYRLPRCIAPYKQSLSQLKNNLRDAFINVKKINVTFTNPLVNVALKFYVISSTSCNFNFQVKIQSQVETQSVQVC